MEVAFGVNKVYILFTLLIKEEFMIKRVGYMKKCIVFVIITLLVFLTACEENKQHKYNQEDLYTQTYETEDFDLQSFINGNEIETGNFGNVGQTDDAKTAVDNAKALWDEKFGTVDGRYYDVTEGRKVNICYDKNEACWLLYGTLPEDTFGSTPVAIIRSNGDVLAVLMK